MKRQRSREYEYSDLYLAYREKAGYDGNKIALCLYKPNKFIICFKVAACDD